MKINWFKINIQDVKYLLIWIIDTLHYEGTIVVRFINYLTMGEICLDCGNNYQICYCNRNYCEKCYQLICICNMNILQWINKNLNSKDYKELLKYYENKLV